MRSVQIGLGENLKNLSELIGSKVFAVVIAHPDDELFYFANLLIHFGKQAQIFCVTDANYAGDSSERLAKLNQVALRLTTRPVFNCNMQDRPDIDLNLELVASRLLQNGLGSYDLVFTHSPHGEYGHFNHRDVYFAVKKALPVGSVFFPADYVYPDYQVSLNEKDFSLKQELIGDFYLKEFREFWKFGRLSYTESYATCGEEESIELHRFFIEGEIPNPDKLNKYKFFWKVLAGKNGLPNF